MKYENVKKAVFIDRPNRFIANIIVDGKPSVCHVKNTGRCKELLVKNAEIYVQEVMKETRKTSYDLITVVKGNRLVNIDSQAPNTVFYEWLMEHKEEREITSIKREFTYKSSRFDFLIDTKKQKILTEVKGVTLEENDVVLFPDAPTERGIKHIKELAASMKEGFSPLMVFLIQMKDVSYFTPNRKTHKAFADELKAAFDAGVAVLAMDCMVTYDSITAGDFVKTVL
jgi:sugar fermentation stimulation protein A